MTAVLTDSWPTDLRIIEIGVRDGRIGRLLLAAGYRRYLGVARGNGAVRDIAARHSLLRPHLYVAPRGRDCVRQNNADAIILGGWNIFYLLRYRSLRHSRFVACPLGPGPLAMLALAFGMLQFLTGRLAWPRVRRLGMEPLTRRNLLVFRVRRPRPYVATRRFLPHALGIEGFFWQLQNAGVRHVVLRWFESLPHLAPGEDLDLLVDDDQLETVRRLLDSGPGLQPIDLYSAHGAPGADFRRMPYYPPYLAEQLLERAVAHRGLCLVPAPQDHFLSLAYHALYHKGGASGLPLGKTQRPPRRQPEHNYRQILHTLARSLHIKAAITLEELDKYLDTQGWRPPHDMLVRLSRKNPWIRPLLKHATESSDDAGLAVFLLRREAMPRGGVEKASRLLKQNGFQIIDTIALDARRAEMVAKSIRGGNWSRGPWSISGGPPAAAIVTYDPHPIRPTRRQRRKFPFLANARLLSKERIRAAFNDSLPAAEHCNTVHSSDNGREALDYLRIIAPERMDKLVARARRATSVGTNGMPASKAA